ncbi:unnamed protein product [Pieris macdunnoughi]|uniref:Uncharacterized protein n=1 Tax=Pieris macdunnoughi TaxID=345717 RepID=A0A821U731_9NEOP|nr:unnamed protein product [Pieris macdunnoughi]
MNLLKLLTIVLLVVTCAKGSVLTTKNLLHPRQRESCFTCKAEDRPFGWSIMSYMGKIKDSVVRSLNGLLEKAKKAKLA